MQSLKMRTMKHFSHSKVATTGIDYAIRKYGKENFVVEKLCDCDNSQLDELERYYIQLYDTYNNGYNLTVGGQEITTKLNLDENEVIEKYLSGLSITQLCEEYNCCDKTISEILHSHDIKIRVKLNLQNIIGKGKPFTEGDGAKSVYLHELNMAFPSLIKCAEWLIDNNYTKTKSPEMARKALSRALHTTNIYQGLHFSFI